MEFLKQLSFNIKYFCLYLLHAFGLYTNKNVPVKTVFTKLFLAKQFETPLPMRLLSEDSAIPMGLHDILTIESIFLDIENIPTKAFDNKPIWNCRNYETLQNCTELLLNSTESRVIFTPEKLGRYRIEVLIDADISSREQAVLGYLDVEVK